jgi:hypothetical protein
MGARVVEDQLREQYFDLLPGLTRLAENLKTEIQYALLPVSAQLRPHESLIVKARVKECISAIDKLRNQVNPRDPSKKRNPGGVFDRDRPEIYTLLDLRDLVGVRVLAFPSRIASNAELLLRSKFPDWEPDAVTDAGRSIALKCNGRYHETCCEYQIVSTLIGLFWDVEHAAIYKQAPNLKGLEPVMRNQTSAVYHALKAFEDEFELQIQRAESGLSIR